MSFGVLALPKVINTVVSGSTGSTTTITSTTPTTVLSVTIKTTGRPVLLALVPDGTASPASISLTVSTGSGASVSFNNGVGSIGVVTYGTASFQTGSLPYVIDTVSGVGSTTYTVKANVIGGTETLRLFYCSLLAFEL